jgi:hypothetical protein
LKHIFGFGDLYHLCHLAFRRMGAEKAMLSDGMREIILG